MARDKDRRNDLLRTAARVFLDQGYQATSMKLVAERAEVTKPGLYYHFKSKQELLFSIMSYGMGLLERAAREAILVAGSNENRLRELIHRHSEMIAREEDGAFSLLVIDLVEHLETGDRRLITHRKKAYFDVIKTLLGHLEKEGKLRNVNLTVATFGLLGMVMWISKWFRPSGELTCDQVADQVTVMAMAAVLKDAG